MKSRTSFFNPTVFRKNISRFAPVWGLYIVCLFMGLFLMMDSGTDYWLLANTAQCIQIMPVVNCGYALVCAQLLFGDLYSTRMCYALHAMPLRREGWFCTNVISGLLFSLVPTALMTVVNLILSFFSYMVNGWQIPLYWWLGSNLQFLLFFGLAVFCALCAGNRIGQFLLYGIINIASLLVFFLIDTLYTPMLYGVRNMEDPFLRFCPVGWMANTEFIDCKRIDTFVGMNAQGYEEYISHGEFTVTGHWWYLTLCAAIGIVLLAVALVLYRKRRLESAGDFLAFRPLEPIFLVVFSLAAGTCIHFLVSQIFGYWQGYVFLFVGIILGYFAGKMLLERNVKVFSRGNWLRCCTLMGAFLLTLLITFLDPMGIESWVPEADEVVGVGVATGHSTYNRSQITLTEKEDIEAILTIHKQAMTDRIDETTRETVEVITASADGPTAEFTTEEVIYKEQIPIKLTYDLVGGKTKTRYYYIYAEDEPGQTLKEYFSTVESVFGMPREDMTEDYLDALAEDLYISGFAIDPVHKLEERLTHADRRALIDAIIADCADGTMAQHYAYHRYEHSVVFFSFKSLDRINEWDYGREIEITIGNRHVMQWFNDMGIDVIAELKEEYGDNYGKY